MAAGGKLYFKCTHRHFYVLMFHVLLMIFRLFFDYSYVTMFSAQLSCFPIFFIVFMFSCYYVHVFSMVFKLYFNCLGNVSAAGGGEPLQAAEKRPLYKTSTPADILRMGIF